MRRRTGYVVGGVAIVLVANAALWLAQATFGFGTAVGPRAIFGPNLVRAEVVVKDVSGVHVYRVDRGRVTRVGARRLRIRERDASVVVVRVAPDARVVVDGTVATLAAVRPRMQVEVVREAEEDAHLVRAVSPPTR